MERQIGATDLRQKLTDVIQAVREEQATYIVETFGRPQVAIVDLDQYRRFQQYWLEREEFFDWLNETARINAEYNADLSEAEILALIDQARTEVYAEMEAEKASKTATS